MVALLILFVFTDILGFHSSDDTKILTLSHGGQIKGKIKTLPNFDYVAEYLGIPYAKSPTGSRRFKAPEPADPWTGVYEASEWPKSCLQKVSSQDSEIIRVDGKLSTLDMTTGRRDFWDMDENCLFLNIWAPLEANTSSKLPVLFFMHGGVFVKGSSSQGVFNGMYMATRENVVVVTVNYRLAMFGFLYSGNEDAPGNMGVLDQLEALKWTSANIENFGGDPDRITLMGSSSGAASAGILALSRHSRPYFKRLILQSGVPNAPWAWSTREEALRNTLVLARQTDCLPSNSSRDHSNISQIVDCLRSINSSSLISHLIEISTPAHMMWKPVVDGHFLHKDPDTLLQHGDFKKCDLLIGTNANEAGSFVGRFLHSPLAYTLMQHTDRSDVVFSVILSNFIFPSICKNVKLPQNVKNHIISLYINENNRNESFARVLTDLMSDTFFTCPSNRFAKAFSDGGNNNSSSVYAYLYDHIPNDKIYPENWGVVHAAELPIVFGHPLNHQNKNDVMTAVTTSEEMSFSKKILRFWANFARNGNPNENEDGTLTTNYWPPFSSNNTDYLHLQPRDIKAGQGQRMETCSFWSTILEV